MYYHVCWMEPVPLVLKRYAYRGAMQSPPSRTDTLGTIRVMSVLCQIKGVKEASWTNSRCLFYRDVCLIEELRKSWLYMILLLNIIFLKPLNIALWLQLKSHTLSHKDRSSCWPPKSQNINFTWLILIFPTAEKKMNTQWFFFLQKEQHTCSEKYI